MFRRTSRLVAAVIAALMTVIIAAPAFAAALSVRVVDADLQPGRSSVQLTVTVKCTAPAAATSYLTTTTWQGSSLHPDAPNYLEGQGQTQILCDGVKHSYSFTNTTTIFYADKKFHRGRAGVESTVQYCIADSPTNTTCTVIFPLIRVRTHIHR
jgi:hypothetical protein